jgi:hypothetical protein
MINNRFMYCTHKIIDFYKSNSTENATFHGIYAEIYYHSRIEHRVQL